MTEKDNIMAIVSKMYCSSSEAVLVVRRRPHVVYGGGFVVTDCSQKVVFRVDGCGVLGKKGEMVLRDSNGDALLLIRQKGGIVEALNINRQWKGYNLDYEGSEKLVFRLKEPIQSCLANCYGPIRISTEPRESSKAGKFEIKGNFPDKDCSIVDSRGDILARVSSSKEEEMEELAAANKDLYCVVVKPDIDQAFVFGVLAVLDYIYGGSTRC